MNGQRTEARCGCCGERLREVAAIGIGRVRGERVRYFLCPACADRAQDDPEAVADTVELRLRRAEGHA